MPEVKTSVQLLQEFFGGERKLSLPEMKALPTKDRLELAELVAKELGYKVIPPTPEDPSPKYSR